MAKKLDLCGNIWYNIHGSKIIKEGRLIEMQSVEEQQTNVGFVQKYYLSPSKTK